MKSGHKLQLKVMVMSYPFNHHSPLQCVTDVGCIYDLAVTWVSALASQWHTEVTKRVCHFTTNDSSLHLIPTNTPDPPWASTCRSRKHQTGHRHLNLTVTVHSSSSDLLIVLANFITEVASWAVFLWVESSLSHAKTVCMWNRGDLPHSAVASPCPPPPNLIWSFPQPLGGEKASPAEFRLQP